MNLTIRLSMAGRRKPKIAAPLPANPAGRYPSQVREGFPALLKADRRNTVCTNLVLLDLLVLNSERIGERFLRHAQCISALSDALPDLMVKRLTP